MCHNFKAVIPHTCFSKILPLETLELACICNQRLLFFTCKDYRRINLDSPSVPTIWHILSQTASFKLCKKHIELKQIHSSQFPKQINQLVAKTNHFHKIICSDPWVIHKICRILETTAKNAQVTSKWKYLQVTQPLQLQHFNSLRRSFSVICLMMDTCK